MDLLSLKYFIAVTEYESFTKAAEHLYVTQPTLSRQIASLEEEFGVRLFVREKRTISLTPAGEVCLKEAREIVKRCDQLAHDLKYTDSSSLHSLSIGYMGLLEYEILTDPLQMFSEEYPNLHTNLVRTNLAELNHFLMDDTFDVIYTVATGLDTLPGIGYTKVAHNLLQLVVPITHPLAQRDIVSVADLANEQFILFERNTSPLTVDHTINMCMEHGFSPNVIHYVRDAQTMLLMVGAGKGIAFLSSRLIKQRPHNVKFLNLSDCTLDFDVVLAYKKNNKNPMIPLFINYVKQVGLNGETIDEVEDQTV